MPYQYKREPLTPDEANRLASVCETHEERLIVWTLLDTGLRVSELAGLTRDQIDWQNHRLRTYGKGGIYGTKSKRHIVPLTNRVLPLIDGHFAIHDTIGMTARTIQRLANRARISRPVSCAPPHLCRCRRAERHLPANTPTAPRTRPTYNYRDLPEPLL